MKEANTNDNILINFGNNIKVFRKKHNISQLDFVNEPECYIDEKTLRTIEGCKSNIRYDTLVKLKKLLKKIDKNITLEELLQSNYM